VPLDESAGEVSCEYVFAYPPGIPLLVPGEILSRELIDRLDGMTKAGLSVKSTYGKIPMEIKLVSRGSREPRIHKNNLNIRK
jgi:arginine/lysine/ornithine decarboxylase